VLKIFKNFRNRFKQAHSDVLTMEANHYISMAKQTDNEERKTVYRSYAKEIRRERDNHKSW